MQKIKTINKLKKIIQSCKSKNKTIGFVPTMGALHQGHLSLLEKCRRENDVAVLSIFVNPAQFSPSEDFKSYPRQEKKDELFAKKRKVDIIFYPSEKKMYPASYLTYVNVEQKPDVLCGKYRPGHFRGVTTIVTKLLNIVTPDALYLGQKDFQQASIIKTMIADLNIATKVKVCPTIREPDGLALSSRNNYLTQRQRKEASILYRSLLNAKRVVLSKKCTPSQIMERIRKDIRKSSSAKIEYIECVDAQSLTPITSFKGKVLIALSTYFGKTRLIDNITFKAQ